MVLQQTSSWFAYWIKKPITEVNSCFTTIAIPPSLSFYFYLLFSFTLDSHTSCDMYSAKFLPWYCKSPRQFLLQFHLLQTTGAVKEIVDLIKNSTYMYLDVVSMVVGRSTQFYIFWAYLATMAQCDRQGEIQNYQSPHPSVSPHYSVVSH